ncbi:MAG TPA: hypothetical protein PL110_17520 [Candidatus Eremiobacteraeota bacterium]|nr:MAG: hypothetical protein BWY64_01708 [bacterium ADurb.Bin363]HPZ09895.1 hypothetical protein [Candidatus Eremiobacteraeota bacterium]
MDEKHSVEQKSPSSLTCSDWEILYEHGGKEIAEVRDLFTEIFEERSNKGEEGPLGDTIGELMITLPESSRNKIYWLLGKAILNCKKKGYLKHIKLK